LMERGSGSYHAELLVKQATDADGAYVGIVTPLAKLSSYPGADAHSVGWRAKGGLRHKHGSTIEAASLAWGQGDRVGLRLDTDLCSLTLYKNGEALTINQLLPVSFGEAGARFCIGRYYGTVEVQCLSMSRIGGSQSIDFTALTALCSRIVPRSSLRILRLAQNQIAGVDSVGGGERKDTGVRELLTLLRGAGCRLDELDLSGNLFTEDDARALFRAAMAPSHTTDAPGVVLAPSPFARERPSAQRLKLHEWMAPLYELKRSGCAPLALTNQDIGPADARLLATALKEELNLTPLTLDLSHNPLGADGTLAIVGGINYRASAGQSIDLVELCLKGVGLRADGATNVLGELKHVSSLRVLDLSSNPLTSKEPMRSTGAWGGLDRGGGSRSGLDDGGRAISTAALEALHDLLCANGAGLEVLRLSQCQLCGPTDSSTDQLSPLSGNRYETRGVAALCAAIRECRSPLKELSLSANRIRAPEVATLLTAASELTRQATNAEPLAIDLDDEARVISESV
jgi:hypothetical protein